MVTGMDGNYRQSSIREITLPSQTADKSTASFSLSLDHAIQTDATSEGSISMPSRQTFGDAGTSCQFVVDRSVSWSNAVDQPPASRVSSCVPSASRMSGGSGVSSTRERSNPNVGSATPPAASPSQASAAPPAIGLTSADRYWNAQPAEVQKLRNIQDPMERRVMANELAKKGYTIDVPIMVWDQDPEFVMRLREQAGYTWVPSALQDPVRVAPGLTFPGLPSYDANAAPAGSIRVNLDFV
jgi:hypothetical protein